MGESNFKKQKVVIFKYFPTKPQGDIGDGRRQRYFTENSFDSAVMAKRYLAVPYEPLYRVKIYSHISSNRLWEYFEDTKKKHRILSPRDKIRRVWASFGLHGGGWEGQTKRIFKQKKMKKSEDETVESGYSGVWSIDKPLLSGGYIDEYCCFTKNYIEIEHDCIIDLLKRFLDRYKAKGGEDFHWKVLDDVIGGVFYWKAGKFEYTISVLVKSYENIYNGVKFWGVFWEDNESENKRTFYRSIEILIPGFPLLKKNELSQSEELKDFKHFLYNRFEEMREMLFEKWNSISRDKEKLVESYSIQLPERSKSA